MGSRKGPLPQPAKDRLGREGLPLHIHHAADRLWADSRTSSPRLVPLVMDLDPGGDIDGQVKYRHLDKSVIQQQEVDQMAQQVMSFFRLCPVSVHLLEISGLVCGPCCSI